MTQFLSIQQQQQQEQQQQQQQYYNFIHHGQPMASPHARAASNKWWSRMSLRGLSIISTIAIVGFSGFYLTRWTIGPMIMMGPPAIAAFLWDCVDVLCLSVRSGRLGVPPAACILVDLLMFVGLGAMSGVIAHTLSKLGDSGWYFAYYSQENVGEEWLRIILGFGVMAALFHLTISIVAIFESKNKRSSPPPPPTQQIVYVQAGPDGALTPMAYVGQHEPLMASSQADSPPAYSSPAHHDSSRRFQDPMEVAAPMSVPAELPEKRA